jgi:hypothetical protein
MRHLRFLPLLLLAFVLMAAGAYAATPSDDLPPAHVTTNPDGSINTQSYGSRHTVVQIAIKHLKPGGCSTIQATYEAAMPAGAALWIEYRTQLIARVLAGHRASSTWLVLKKGAPDSLTAGASLCVKASGTGANVRATLRESGNQITDSTFAFWMDWCKTGKDSHCK